jgi:hypothetical protein
VVKEFANKITDFLGDTKTTLLKMVNEFDQNEILNAQSLGPVLPAGEVTKEILCERIDEFTEGFSDLVTKVTENWQAVGEART